MKNGFLKDLLFLEDDESDSSLEEDNNENVDDTTEPESDDAQSNESIENNDDTDRPKMDLNKITNDPDLNNDDEPTGENPDDDTVNIVDDEDTGINIIDDDSEDENESENENSDDDTKEEELSNPNGEKAYYASPNNYEEGIDLEGPLFVSPLKGIASIFVTPRDPERRKKDYGAHGKYNLKYDEWENALSDLQLPLKEVHITVEGNDDIPQKTLTYHGYIHTIDMDKYKQYKESRWPDYPMDKEFLIKGVDHVDFESVEEWTITAYIKGESKVEQESYIDKLISDFIMEEKLSTEDRKTVTHWGLPDEKKYPLPDKSHVRSALRFFNDCPEAKRKTLAKNIVRRANDLSMDWTKWGQLKPYLSLARQNKMK